MTYEAYPAKPNEKYTSGGGYHDELMKIYDRKVVEIDRRNEERRVYDENKFKPIQQPSDFLEEAPLRPIRNQDNAQAILDLEAHERAFNAYRARKRANEDANEEYQKYEKGRMLRLQPEKVKTELIKVEDIKNYTTNRLLKERFRAFSEKTNEGIILGQQIDDYLNLTYLNDHNPKDKEEKIKVVNERLARREEQIELRDKLLLENTKESLQRAKEIDEELVRESMVLQNNNQNAPHLRVDNNPASYQTEVAILALIVGVGLVSYLISAIIFRDKKKSE